MITVPWTRRTVVSGETTAPVPEKNRLEKGLTVATLAGVALVAYFGERNGMMHGWDTTAREIGESGAHPVLGYVGAFLGVAVAKRHVQKSKVVEAAVIGVAATAVNFGTETVQSLVTEPSIFTEFWAGPNQPETVKDWGFALAGACIYWLQNHNKPPQSQHIHE